MKQFSKFLIGLIVTMIFASGLALLSSSSAYADAPPSGCKIVHRGLGPEESIPSLKRAINRGACGIEADVHGTSDHVKILNHDSTLNRTTTGTGPVSKRTYAYVSRLHVRKNSWGRASHDRVATYEQALVLCRDSRVQVCMFEAKKGMSQDMVLSMASDAVRIMGDKLYKVTIEADTYAQSRTIKGSDFKQVSVAYVAFDRWPSVSAVKASKADGIIVNRPVMSRARVASAAQAGLWVTPYSIETRSQFQRVRSMGAHGVMTDSARLIG